jgi:hypothetical protein
MAAGKENNDMSIRKPPFLIFNGINQCRDDPEHLAIPYLIYQIFQLRAKHFDDDIKPISDSLIGKKRGDDLFLSKISCKSHKEIRFAKMGNQTYRILKKLLYGAVAAKERRR